MRRFKFLLMSFVIAISLLGTSHITTASTYSTGKAVLPFYYLDHNSTTSFAFSNITDAPINVTITIYNMNGTLLTDDNNVNTGKITGMYYLSNYHDQNTDSTLTFTLAAHVTGYFYLTANTISNLGYGVIQWSQNSSALNGLVGSGSYNHPVAGEWTTYSIPVNAGLPF